MSKLTDGAPTMFKHGTAAVPTVSAQLPSRLLAYKADTIWQQRSASCTVWFDPEHRTRLICRNLVPRRPLMLPVP